MSPAQIVEMRTMLGEGNILVFADNVKLFDENSKYVNFIWDDDSQVLHVIRTNMNYYKNKVNQFEHIVLGYDVIQYMTAPIQAQNLSAELDKLVASAGLSPEKKAAILEEFATLSANIYPNNIIPEI